MYLPTPPAPTPPLDAQLDRPFIELDVKSVEAHFQYLVTVSPTDIYDVARFAATVGPDTMEAAMNTADVLCAEGRAEGRVEARADMLIELLTAKFGKLDPRIRNRVEHATTGADLRMESTDWSSATGPRPGVRRVIAITSDSTVPYTLSCAVREAKPTASP